MYHSFISNKTSGLNYGSFIMGNLPNNGSDDIGMFEKIKMVARKIDKYLIHESDPLTTTLLRYNGFWNNIGEALKTFLPKWIYYGTYVATISYVTTTIYYTNRRAYKKNSHNICNNIELNENTENKLKNILLNEICKIQVRSEIIDNIIWHSLATVSLTPMTIALIKRLIKNYLEKKTNIHPFMNIKLIPSFIGILMIGIIVSPIDNAVTYGMNRIRIEKKPYHWTGIYSSLN